MVDVAGVVEAADEPIGDEFMVEDEGRRPASFGDSSPFLSFVRADGLLLFLESLCRKEGIAAMLLWLWDSECCYELIGVTSGSRKADAEKL